jgi:hypothetical protein
MHGEKKGNCPPKTEVKYPIQAIPFQRRAIVLCFPFRRRDTKVRASQPVCMQNMCEKANQFPEIATVKKKKGEENKCSRCDLNANCLS